MCIDWWKVQNMTQYLVYIQTDTLIANDGPKDGKDVLSSTDHTDVTDKISYEKGQLIAAVFQATHNTGSGRRPEGE